MSKPREFGISDFPKNEDPDWVEWPPEDGLEYNYVHVIEKSAYDKAVYCIMKMDTEEYRHATAAKRTELIEEALKELGEI